MSLIDVRNVEKIYQLGRTSVPALKGVSFAVNPGEFISIMGPSGCGKTTLLNVIGCIDRASAGEVLIEDTNVEDLSDNQEADIRLHKIGFIFQSFNLIPVLNVYENVEFPMILAGTPRNRRREQIMYLIEEVGLQEFIDHKPDELSGGQRQRVAIARALVNRPKMVIADEPTANLDSETGDMVLQVMRELNERDKVTFIFSTHNPDVNRYAGRVIRLKDGLISSDEARQPAGQAG
jgi:putative ABC transport system ATP-binding protein